MIVVSGTVVVGAGRDRALVAAREMARATRQESGCRSYAFSVDTEDSGTLRVFEEWEDDEALDLHLRSEHMRAFRQALTDVEIRSRDVRRYVVTEVTKL